MDQKKPTLNIDRGEVCRLTLESNTPFAEGESENQWGKKAWHGYNVVVEGSEGKTTEFTLFASDAQHDVIQASGVEGGEFFTLELKAEKNKAGELRSNWYLNGKTKYKYEEAQDQGQDKVETAESTVAPPSIKPDPEPLITPGSVDQPEVKQETPDNKNAIIKDLIDQVRINLSNAEGLMKKIEDEMVVPF